MSLSHYFSWVCHTCLISESVNIATIVTPKTNMSPLKRMAASWKIIFLLPGNILPGLHVTNTSLPGLPHLNGRRSAGAMLTSSDFLLCQCQLAQNGQLPVGTLISQGSCRSWRVFKDTFHTTGSMGYLFKHHIALQLFEHSTDFFKDHLIFRWFPLPYMERKCTLWCYLTKSRFCLSREYDWYIVRYNLGPAH